MSIEAVQQEIATWDDTQIRRLIAYALALQDRKCGRISAANVTASDADSYIRERAARGNREDFDRVMSKVPNVEPEEHDRPSPHNSA